jgi:hypothetical protein
MQQASTKKGVFEMEYVPGMKSIPTSEITPNDVLCGRGGNINSHPGNERFRRIVESKKRLYLTSRFKREKRVIACNIVDEIKAQNGRFLAKINVTGSKRGRKKAPDPGWYEVDIEKAREKTSQALRENASEIRKELVAGPETCTHVAAPDPSQKDCGRVEEYQTQPVVSGNVSAKLQQSKTDNDSHSWIQDFQEIHMSNSWNSFKTDLASFSSLSNMFIPITGSRSSLSEHSQRGKSSDKQTRGDPMKTPIREKRVGMECPSAQACDRKKKSIIASSANDHSKVAHIHGLESPDNPSMLPPPPKRHIMREWVAETISSATARLDYRNFGLNTSMSYNMDVEMENVAESAEVPAFRSLVDIPQQQEKSSRRDEEIVERSWFPCGSWTPADWTTSFFSCGSAVFKADSFEYVSDSLCDGFDVPNPCSMYLENEPHNKPYTTFDSPNTKPSIVQSTSSYNFEDVQMEDRFMGGYSSLPSVAEKSHRSGPESSSEHSSSEMYDLSERKPPRNLQYPIGNVNNEDIRHQTIQLSPIKWKAITNNADHQKTNQNFYRSNIVTLNKEWSDHESQRLRMQGRQAQGY